MLRLTPHGAIAVGPMAREMTEAATGVKGDRNVAVPGGGRSWYSGLRGYDRRAPPRHWVSPHTDEARQGHNGSANK